MPKDPITSRSDLENEAKQLEDRNQSLDSVRNSNKANAKELKVKLIRDLFAIMKEVGVDPNDMVSINRFLQQLNQQDPDLGEIFQVAFNNLIGDRDVNPQAPPPPPPENGGLMNTKTNLQESILRRPQPSQPSQLQPQPQPEGGGTIV